MVLRELVMSVRLDAAEVLQVNLVSHQRHAGPPLSAHKTHPGRLQPVLYNSDLRDSHECLQKHVWGEQIFTRQHIRMFDVYEL